MNTVVKKNHLSTFPVELVYEVMKWLTPFDILNLSYILNVKYTRSFNDELRKYIKAFCNNNAFETIVTHIIRDNKFVNYDILRIFSNIVEIITKSSKYMDILGYNTYIFNIKYGLPYISTHTIPIIYMDTQIINIQFPDIDTLEFYLEKYMNFYKNKNNLYRVKKYELKHLVHKKSKRYERLYISVCFALDVLFHLKSLNLKHQYHIVNQKTVIADIVMNVVRCIY
jgi:hypothetical protein